MAVTNIGTYGFQMVAARVLGPSDYGAIASMMAFLLVVAVLQLGLQATAARRIAEHALEERQPMPCEGVSPRVIAEACERAQRDNDTPGGYKMACYYYRKACAEAGVC